MVTAESPITLKSAKRWLNLDEFCEDDELIETEIIPVAVELFRQRSGRIVGVAEVCQIYDEWPDCFEFKYRPVLQLCGIWCKKDGADWVQSPGDKWVSEVNAQPPLLRPACVDGCSCECCYSCCECPTRWKIKYLAGQRDCTLNPIDAAWIKAVVAEMYRVRDASLETAFTNTRAFQRLDDAVKRMPGPCFV